MMSEFVVMVVGSAIGFGGALALADVVKTYLRHTMRIKVGRALDNE